MAHDGSVNVGDSTSSETVFQSETGVTRDGVPLALNRPPAEGLEPWVARSMVAFAYDRTNVTHFGTLCNDAAYLRSAVGVDWMVGTGDGPLNIRDQTFLCGQHSKSWGLEYVGGIKVAGLMLRPGALHALWGVPDAELVDRIRPMEIAGVADRDLTGLYNLDLEPNEWLTAIEEWLLIYIAEHGARKPEELSQCFELQSFADPNRSLADFTDEHGISMRTLQRIVKRDFGQTPKQVMRRARVLDFAARLCGVADQEEEDEFILRFFDQAHQIHEFQAFFGMAPREFTRNRQGLLTLSLEIRQARRLELLERISPESVRPWMREPFKPAFNQTKN
ncbi:MAG: helix-turn-helix domain-containing protein [Sphingomonadaceae bacterium]|jgi:AraC-like DNA-binding protein|nr:helix-turn-helix domain-containing protein [Sphingomonadaceae bacterium]